MLLFEASVQKQQRQSRCVDTEKTGERHSSCLSPFFLLFIREINSEKEKRDSRTLLQHLLHHPVKPADF